MDGVASRATETRRTEPLVFGQQLMWPWIVANSVAFTIGGLVGGGALRAIIGPWFGSDVSALEAARIQATGAGLSAAIFWTLAGTAQWLVLRRAIRAASWLPATVLGWILAGVLMGFSSGGSTSTIGPDEAPVPLVVTLSVVVPLIVLLIGGGQWLILRRAATSADLWPLVDAGALVAAGFLGLTVAKLLPWIAGTRYPSGQALAVVGFVSGPLYGWITWQFLAHLSRRPEEAEGS